jgi:glycosyltransferase involved in cell wall biosynthesis
MIVVVYNNCHTLQRCIDGVVSQNYPHTELIIIDGCSVDRPVDIINRNNSNIAYWESEKDRGMCHAFNKGLSRAK